MAVVNGATITRQELDQAVKGQVRRLERQQAEDRYSLLTSGLDSLIAKKLVLAEVAKRGTTEENLLRTEVEARAVPPTDAEMRQFYEANIRQMPGPYEMVRDRIRQHLLGLKQREALMKYLQGLRAAAKVETSLPPIELPRVDVAAEARRGARHRSSASGPVLRFPVSVLQRGQKSCGKNRGRLRGKSARGVPRLSAAKPRKRPSKRLKPDTAPINRGKFWEMHDLMFTNQDKLAPEGLKSLARQIGLDGAKFDACGIDGGSMAETVKNHFQAGEDAGVDATPAFFINGRPVAGAVPFEELRKVIDKELGVQGA